MKKRYIRPAIEVVSQQYGEGFMATLSIPYSGTTTTGPGDAKPGDTWDNQVKADDTWGDIWTRQD